MKSQVIKLTGVAAAIAALSIGGYSFGTHSITAAHAEGAPAASAVAPAPSAIPALALPDFQVSALELGRGRYVEGFARALNVGPETFRALQP